MAYRKCAKCHKKYEKDSPGHMVYPVGGKPKFYHWDCFDERYNEKVNLLLSKGVKINDK